MKKLKCPYCKRFAKLVESSEIYNGSRDYGYLYFCDCDPEYVYVGCHKGTKKPLGTLANKELRSLRKDLHIIFDQRWENGKCQRTNSYRWLAKQMGITNNKCHIGKFNKEQCEEALMICLNNM